ncbi:hypothetical protein [Bacteroides sp.]|uniref:hypothetical protein n=1 Tax=Bacteroides sp. TaxID=29523 RepID=UPI00260E68CA|nr:hypothetical protein [Bacteroides sp.]MDD3036989.1 hypothetical protein [Bacteroides sp.]
MKLKQCVSIFGYLYLTFSLSSCVKDKNLFEEPEITYSEVQLDLGGECFSTERPLERAVPNYTRDLLGITVTMLAENDGTTVSKPYAYGIFNVGTTLNDKLKLNLIDGYQYRISCTMIKRAKDSIMVGNEIQCPLDLERNGKILGTVTDKFITAEQPDGQQKTLYNLESTKIKTGNQDNYTRPFAERYHGVLEKGDIKMGKTNIIKIYRRFFGVKFKQAGLQAGKLRIEMDGAPAIYLPAAPNPNLGTTETEAQMVSMKNITAAIPANSPLTEGVKVTVYLCQEGKQEKIILATSLTFKRNYMHTIVLTNIDHMGTPGNVSIDIDEEEMKDDYQQDIPWQD